jgi:putative acetyltransferase
MHDGNVLVRREDLGSAVAAALIGELNAELLRTYPEEGATHFRLDPDEVAGERGAFLVATAQGAPVGCGAIRRLDARTAELKRMFVLPAMRPRRRATRPRDRRAPASGARALRPDGLRSHPRLR